MINKIVLLLVFLASFSAHAVTCEDGMKKFKKYPESRAAGLCKKFQTEELFKKFQDCLLSSAKMFDPSLTEETLQEKEEKELSGVIRMCAMGMSSNSAQPKRTQTADGNGTGGLKSDTQPAY